LACFTVKILTPVSDASDSQGCCGQHDHLGQLLMLDKLLQLLLLQERLYAKIGV